MPATLAAPTPQMASAGPVVASAARIGLGLTVPELEDLLIAIGDREDLAGPDERARLIRGRRALEAELVRLLLSTH